MIAAALEDSYKAYEKFIGNLPTMDIDTEWRYYNDGKSWLLKATAKKKTVFLAFCLGRLFPHYPVFHGENPGRHTITSRHG